MKIHRIKDWDYDENLSRLCDETSDSSGDEPSDDRDATSLPYQGVEDVTANGQSWLSNETIIASIPDAHLRQTLSRYRDLVRLCETELRRRKDAGITRRAYDGNRDTERFEMLTFGSVRPSSTRRVSAAITQLQSRQPRQPRRKPKNQLTLTPDQMIKALEALCNIRTKTTTADHERHMQSTVSKDH